MMTSARLQQHPTVLSQASCLKERLAYCIPTEHADRKAPGKAATSKWNKVIPNTFVKFVILNISVIIVSIFKTYIFPTLEFDHDHLLGTWTVMLNGEEDGTVSCITTSSTEKTCDFSKHGIRKMKSSHLPSKRRSNMQSRSAGLTLDPQGKKKLQWGNGHHWIEGKY